MQFIFLPIYTIIINIFYFHLNSCIRNFLKKKQQLGPFLVLMVEQWNDHRKLWVSFLALPLGLYTFFFSISASPMKNGNL